jgi:hypothetical protein
VICTVGTVKDSLANVRVYVERNLAAGADHMFVFLDAPIAKVELWLAAHPHVTAVVCDDAYWTPERPERLNARQVTNANLVQAALAAMPWESWLFHLDADESLQLDRDRLAEVPADFDVVVLDPLEAISQLESRPDIPHFKRRLGPRRMAELVAAGVVPPTEEGEPLNSTYFRGHLLGKIGVRPRLDQWMQLHRVVRCGPEEDEVPTFRADWLAHRHYESVTGEEFIRKWMSHLGAGEIRLRPRRRALLATISAVMADPALDEAGRREALTRIYTEQVQDRYDDLLAAGVLVVPEDRQCVPRPFPPGGREQLERVLALLLGADKRYANPRITDLWPRQLFEQLAREHADVAPLLEPAIADARRSEAARGAVPPESGGAEARDGRSLWSRTRARLGRR